jgi:hypothetical protein
LPEVKSLPRHRDQQNSQACYKYQQAGFQEHAY